MVTSEPPTSSEVVLGTDGKTCVAVVSLTACARYTREKLSLHDGSLEHTLYAFLIL